MGGLEGTFWVMEIFFIEAEFTLFYSFVKTHVKPHWYG